MSLLIDTARIAVALNIVLLGVVMSVWTRNYVRLRSKHTLGMLVFAALLLLENGFALYYYLVDPALSAWFSTQVPDIAWQAMLLFHLLETFAIAVITWTTLD